MQSKIKVRIKNVYGVEKVYPICATAQTFADLAGTRTLTREALRLIQSLGYQVEVEAPQLSDVA